MWGRRERSGSPFRRSVISEWRRLCEISHPQKEKITPNYESGLNCHSTWAVRAYPVRQWANVRERCELFTPDKLSESAGTASVRRRCSLAPDRHESRQKRKWPVGRAAGGAVGRGWCPPPNRGGRRGAPSPSTAERQDRHDGARKTNKVPPTRKKREKTWESCLVNFNAERSRTFSYFFKRDGPERNFKSASSWLNLN